MGTQLPPPEKNGHSPPFSAHFCCGQTAVCIRIPLEVCLGLGENDIVLDIVSAPSPLKGHSPQFFDNVRCDQTAGWTKMPLGMEVGLGPGNCVRWGPRSLRKRHSPHPVFGPCLLWPNGWMDEDATWYGSRPRYMLNGDTAPPRKGHSSPPYFRPMSVVAAVAHLRLS